jgi:hypothetical protein
MPIEQASAPLEQAVDGLIKALERAHTQNLEGLTLRDLILQTEALRQASKPAADA